MLHIFSGDDGFSKNEELKKLKQELGGEALLESNIATFDGAKISQAELGANVSAMPFLSEKRLVIVEGLLAKFEKGAAKKAADKKTTAKSAEPSGFAGILKSIPPTTELILIEDKISPANSLFKEVTSGGGQKADIKFFNQLKGAEITKWAETRARAKGAKISSDAISLLKTLIGGNLWVMDSEVTKLALYAEGRLITEEDVKSLVGYAQQTSIFSLVDAIMEGRTASAQKLLAKQLDDGASPSYILHMISRQVRLMMLAKDILSTGVSDGECQKRAGIASDYAFGKVKAQAKKYSAKALESMYKNIFEADLSIKTGKATPELAAAMLVGKLCLSAGKAF